MARPRKTLDTQGQAQEVLKRLKKDPVELAKPQDQQAQKLADLRLDPKRPLGLWICDEMGYGLASATWKMWTTKGTEIIAPAHHRCEWAYVYGVLQVGGGFMEQINRRTPYVMHVVTGDGAGFHHKGDQDNEGEVPDNVRVSTLSPCSPEPSPVERLWGVIKDGTCVFVGWWSLFALGTKHLVIQP